MNHASQKLKNQPRACACIKRMNEAPQVVAIRDVRDYEFDERKIRKVLEKSKKANNYYLSIKETLESIEQRQNLIKQIAQEFEPDEEPAPKPKSSKLK